MSGLIPIATCIQDTWEIIKPIGKGSFSEIYAAYDINSNDINESLVAVKVETEEATVLKWESNVLQSLNGNQCVPKFYSYGQINRRNYIVMELLRGEDMAALRNRVRSASPSGLVPISIATYLARQMLSCIKCMHEKGFVHRDVKPSNFVRRSKESTEFCVIDFGLTKQYREKDGRLKPAREKADFRGTTVYASPYTHMQQDQCPRDDLCSIFHAFLDMICGKLPWGDAARSKDKYNVIEIKNKCYEDINYFINWEVNQTLENENGKNLPTTNFPLIAQQKCHEILLLLKSLTYEETPNYDLLDRLFAECVPIDFNQPVDDINFSIEGIFKWKDSTDIGESIMNYLSKPNRESTNRLTSRKSLTFIENPMIIEDKTQKQNHFVQQMSKLHNFLPSYSTTNLNNNNNSNPLPIAILSKSNRQELYSLSQQWKNLVKDYLEDEDISIKGLEACHNILVEYNHFFEIFLGDYNENWNEYIQFQEFVGLFYEHLALFKKRKAFFLNMDSNQLEFKSESNIYPSKRSFDASFA